MKKQFVCVMAMFIAGFTANVYAQDAAAIVEASKNSVTADTVSTRSRMVITAKNGSTTEREIDQYAKDNAQGYDRTVIIFRTPASVAGTRFLTMERESGNDDRWIYLPSLGKVRRVAASESGGSFMGTDFSYDDMSLTSRKTEEDTHTLLREETLDGKACYVIESKSKDPGYPYSKTVRWIDKDTKKLYKVDLSNQKGVLVKQLEMSGFKMIQGRLTQTHTKISTLAAGTSTTIFTDIIKYDDPIPEGVFTTAYLETGRAR
jgi:outer membrane lipoprotein-sorting protein